MTLVDFLDKKYYLNRECTWLEFNQRVLQEALAPLNPLLEQLKFIAIGASNLDEFFMIRVAGIKHLIESGVVHYDIANLTPDEQFNAISAFAHDQVQDQYDYLRKVLDKMRLEGLSFIKANQLDEAQLQWLDDYFEREIYPVVTPMAVDAAHPFPFLVSLGMNLAVLLKKHGDDTSVKTAILPVPSPAIERIIKVPATKKPMKFLLLEDVLCRYAHRFFVGYDIIETTAFRLTRDADLDINDDVDDLLTEVEKSLKRRLKGSAVRLEIDAGASCLLIHFLATELHLCDSDIYKINGPLDCSVFFSIADIKGYDYLRYKEVKPRPSYELAEAREKDLWSAIAKQAIMVHHPFESFRIVEDFISLAARDENVLAIKQTLYRVSSRSKIIAALAEAAENGKQVTVLMEVKARFDEENNIQMARRLEKAGCHVIYGFMGLKTHSKITLVVRRERRKIRRYVHLATGNYNGATAKIYTDIGLFTADPLIGQDASAFFNVLSGYSDPPVWNKLIMAPLNLRERIICEIEQEIAIVKGGRKERIIAKMNSLLDKKVIAKLYEASSAGVRIDLIVRGICVLRPGLEGISENIHVRSIVGRFLEHSRLFYFRNDGKEDVFLSSADWMPRNLNERVELMVPIEDERHKKRIKAILKLYLRDNVKAYIMESDGTYVAAAPLGDEKEVNAQQVLCKSIQQKMMDLK